MRVVTIANRQPTESYYCFVEMLNSCRRFGHEPLILGNDGSSYQGLGTKPLILKRAIEQGKISDEHMIFTDAFDVVFQSDPALAVARAFIDYPKRIVFNAEKNLFPANPNDNHPESPTPWRYLNSGFIVGPTDIFLSCLKAIDPNDMRPDRQREDGSWDTPNDQETWQRLYCKGELPISLDFKCEIAQTLCGVNEDELDFSGSNIVNKVTGETPVSFHLNGSKEFWKPRILSKLGL